MGVGSGCEGRRVALRGSASREADETAELEERVEPTG
jgi:hypothetical protein